MNLPVIYQCTESKINIVYCVSVRETQISVSVALRPADNILTGYFETIFDLCKILSYYIWSHVKKNEQNICIKRHMGH